VNPRWAVFVSGRGSNLQSVLDIHAQYSQIQLVVSNKPEAEALLKAKRQGVRTLKLEANFNWDLLVHKLKCEGITHVLLLGFMKLVPAKLCDEYKDKIFNLHPSLLPEFPGLKAIEKSHAAGRTMGVSVHRVTAEMDAGEVLYQIKTTDSACNIKLERALELISAAERRAVQFIFSRVHV
jgi:phosphoribosylglycinamide formyltransferase-1